MDYRHIYGILTESGLKGGLRLSAEKERLENVVEFSSPQGMNQRNLCLYLQPSIDPNTKQDEDNPPAERHGLL